MSTNRLLRVVLGPGRRQVRADIEAVTAPTLLVQGAQDRLVTRASTERVAARRPDREYRVYPDLGHVVMLEDPVVADIADWRGRVGLQPG